MHGAWPQEFTCGGECHLITLVCQVAVYDVVSIYHSLCHGGVYVKIPPNRPTLTEFDNAPSITTLAVIISHCQ